MKSNDQSTRKNNTALPSMRIHQDSEIRGKPNMIINDIGINHGSYVNNSLTKMSMEDLVQIAERYTDDDHQLKKTQS